MAHTAQKISSSANRAGSTAALLKLTPTPSAPPASAVAIPIRKPPNAVAKNTAGIYGVKNTSGRIGASPPRAAVAKTRQQPAKPVPNSGEGWEIPCQPRLNSSINFIIGPVTSCDQRIQNKAGSAENGYFETSGGRHRLWPPAARREQARLRCSRPAGILADHRPGCGIAQGEYQCPQHLMRGSIESISAHFIRRSLPVSPWHS